MEVSNEVKKALDLAIKVRENAYAPYSKFQVGACFKLKNQDEYVAGCNMENASYGATICAERGAVQSTVAQVGKPDYEFLVVVTNTSPATQPCGLCLQVMAEFVPGDFPVYLANLQGIERVVPFNQLLTTPFSKIPGQNE